MTCQRQDNETESALELTAQHGRDGLGDAVAVLINKPMRVGRERYRNAEWYELTPQRRGYAHGYKPKTVRSRIGALELAVPQARWRLLSAGVGQRPALRNIP